MMISIEYRGQFADLAIVANFDVNVGHDCGSPIDEDPIPELQRSSRDGANFYATLCSSNSETLSDRDGTSGH
jgi:hypothetical protein